MPDWSAEALRSELMAEAVRRFGAERAEALASELQALAGDLARVAAAPIPDETEPAFFLLEA